MNKRERRAADILLTELASHFGLDENIRRDPSLYLAYDAFSVTLGDETDAEGVALAKSLLPPDFVLESNV